jgi:hypothetical protein
MAPQAIASHDVKAYIANPQASNRNIAALTTMVIERRLTNGSFRVVQNAAPVALMGEPSIKLSTKRLL